MHGSKQSIQPWSDDWVPFLAAWAKRFQLYPSDAQRAMLWGNGEDHGAIRDWPEDCGRWVTEAPLGARAHDVVMYVLHRFQRHYADLDARIPRDDDPIKPYREPRAIAAMARIGGIVGILGDSIRRSGAD